MLRFSTSAYFGMKVNLVSILGGGVNGNYQITISKSFQRVRKNNKKLRRKENFCSKQFCFLPFGVTQLII